VQHHLYLREKAIPQSKYVVIVGTIGREGDKDEFFQGELATLSEYLRTVGGYDSQGVSIKK
jgi:hypothetical protein